MGTTYSIEKYDSFTAMLFTDIGLTDKDIQLLSQEFDRINVCGSGKISRHEFYTTFGYDETVCIKKLFLLCSKAGVTQLDFEDFVCLMWNFLTLELADVVPVLFHLYDTDVTGI
jgi:Ca2+-binding EF-hand superfamily protein